MKALITGSEGFIGYFLIKELLDKGHNVIATYKEKAPNLSEQVQLIKLDILNKQDLINVLDRYMPNIVFHLASADRFEEDEDIINEINVEGTKNLIETIEDIDKSPSLVIIGSAEEYGIPKLLPLNEQHPLSPISLFGKSKLLAENLAKDSAKKGFRVIIIRSFDIIGPGQDEKYFVSGLAKQIADFEKGKIKKIKIENLNQKIDFVDVRDAVRGYILAAEKGDSGEIYNICSGNAYEFKEISNKFLNLAKKRPEVDEKTIKSAIPLIVGDNRKFFKKTGWRALIDIDTSINDILSYWRNNK